MSTAGKVLTVIVTLVAFVWLLLASGVGELNRNGGKAVASLQKKVADLDEQIAKARTDLSTLIDQASVQRSKTQIKLAELQAKQAEVEKARSQMIELATRVKYQLETVAAAVKQAQANSQQRQAELEAEKKAVADAKQSVEQLKAENKESRDTKAALEDKFRTTYAENKQLVERLKSKPGAGRTASYTR
jgi:chromosome segregation ATPase